MCDRKKTFLTDGREELQNLNGSVELVETFRGYFTPFHLRREKYIPPTPKGS
jgi:hypothetical protein